MKRSTYQQLGTTVTPAASAASSTNAVSRPAMPFPSYAGWTTVEYTSQTPGPTATRERPTTVPSSAAVNIPSSTRRSSRVASDMSSRYPGMPVAPTKPSQSSTDTGPAACQQVLNHRDSRGLD